MLNQIAHLLHAVGLCGLALLACDTETAGLQRILGKKIIFDSGVKNLVQYDFHLILGGLGGVHAVEKPLHVVCGDVLDIQALESWEQIFCDLPPICDAGHSLDIGL